MKTWLIRIVTNACALAAAAWLFSGIKITGDTDRDRVITLLLVALLFGVVNEFVRPIVAFLSLPLYLLTLGLMFFVAPSGMVLPSLAMAGVGYDRWLRFIGPFLLLLTALAAAALVLGVLF